jgi:hypothetical protein
MPTEPLTGSRYPQSSDSPNIAQFIQNAVGDLADNTIPRFDTRSARDAAYATWASLGNAMTNGMLSSVGGYIEEYFGGAWIPDLKRHGVEMDTIVNVQIPPNGSQGSPTAFGTADVVGSDPEGYLQAGTEFHVKIPPNRGGLYTINWGGRLGSVPTGRHFWDLLIAGSRSDAIRANGFGEDGACGSTALRLAAGDTVRFQIYVAGTGPVGAGNWLVIRRMLSVFLVGA